VFSGYVYKHKLPDCSISWIEETILTVAGQFNDCLNYVHLKNFSVIITYDLCDAGYKLSYESFISKQLKKRHRKFFRCTYEKIAEILQQVWGSFLQVISQPPFTNISFM